MNLKIEINDSEVQTITGVSAKGKPYSMQLQTAYFHQDGQVYPDKFEVILPRPKNDKEVVSPYPKGFYTVDYSKSFNVYNGRLSFNPVLVPAKKTG